MLCTALMRGKKYISFCLIPAKDPNCTYGSGETDWCWVETWRTPLHAAQIHFTSKNYRAKAHLRVRWKSGSVWREYLSINLS